MTLINLSVKGNSEMEDIIIADVASRREQWD